MRKTWLAVVCVFIFTLISGAAVFFSTAGPSWLAEELSLAAAGAQPAWQERLYSWSLAVNPYDASTRLALAGLYGSQGQNRQAQTLLQEGVALSTDPDLYLALAASYVEEGRLEDACLLLDNAAGEYLPRRLSSLRPAPPEGPASGPYPEGHPFYFSCRQGELFLQLDGGDWTLWDGPLRLSPGSHVLRLVTLRENVPSTMTVYRYSISPARPASLTLPPPNPPQPVGPEPQ